MVSPDRLEDSVPTSGTTPVSDIAGFNPESWYDRNPHELYNLSNIIYSTGRKGTTPNITEKTRSIATELAVDLQEGVERDIAVEIAKRLGPPNTAKQSAARAKTPGILKGLGIEYDVNGKQITEIMPGDTFLTRMAKGSWKTAENRRRVLQINEDGLTIRQSIGIEITGRVLSVVAKAQSEDHLSIDLEKDPRKVLKTVKVPNNHRTAIKGLSEAQAAKFVTDTVRETIETLLEQREDQPYQSLGEAALENLDKLIALGISAEEIVYFIFDNFRVDPPKEYKEKVTSPKLKPSSKQRQALYAKSNFQKLS